MENVVKDAQIQTTALQYNKSVQLPAYFDVTCIIDRSISEAFTWQRGKWVLQ